MKNFDIALDGPAGSGKSTVAKIVAKKLNINYLDTGAMYRAVGYYILSKDIELFDILSIEEAINTIKMNIIFKNGVQYVFVNDFDVTEEIRKPEISNAASKVAAVQKVRNFLVELQRKIAEKENIILDGRDIGTVVLKDSKFKFFLTASSEIRAKRRHDEFIQLGVQSNFEKIKESIEIRDDFDSNREHSPLKMAEDAIEIDSSNLTIDQVVCKIVDYVESRS